jgi:hypothetical protein
MSVRFTPNWNPDGPDQVIGFMQLVGTVTASLGYGLHWVEVGSYLGESATLTLGFSQVGQLDCIESNATHADALRRKFSSHARRCSITHAASVDAARGYPPRSLHAVYIDADHGYESVIADIDAWLPKVRLNGFVGGHDYHEGFPGVMRAVRERFVGVKTFCDSSWLASLT